MRLWTKEQIAYIVDNWHLKEKKALAREVSCASPTLYKVWKEVKKNKYGTEASVELYGKYLESMNQRYVTKEEQQGVEDGTILLPYLLTFEQTEQFKELWPSTSQSELGEIFGLQLAQVKNLGKKLKLKKKRPAPVTKSISEEEVLMAIMQNEIIEEQNLDLLEIGKRYLFTDYMSGGWYIEKAGRVISDCGKFYLIEFDGGYKETMLKATLFAKDIEYKEVDDDYKVDYNGGFTLRLDEEEVACGED